ncbi:hypothetical protein EOW05_00735 [Salmonella enterica]|nr:hypothetical protein [Salmonella enterica]
MKKIAALTLFVLIICGVLFVIGRVGAAIGCNDVSVQTELPTKYSPLSGCYIKRDGQWVPLDWRL